MDASPALDLLGNLQGRTVSEAIELLGSVALGAPEVGRDIGHLLNAGLRAPKSVRQPIGPG